MPHFDEFGGDEWVCQAPNHRGNRVQNSRVNSEWRPDITGIEGAGNVCPACLQEFNRKALDETMERIEQNDMGYMTPPEPIRGPKRRLVSRARVVHPVEGQYSKFRLLDDGPEELIECGAIITCDDELMDPEERFVQNQIKRAGGNAPRPERCNECQGQLESSQGMVGEEVLICPIHGLKWENVED